MQLSSDEARALAFIGALVGLALLGRWVDRPRAVLAGAETVDIAELQARSGPAPAAADARGRNGSARVAGGGARGVGTGARLDLNRATAAELEALPGVGPALAGRIVAYRDSVGRFVQPEDLDRVRGVGPALLAKLAPLVRVMP